MKANMDKRIVCWMFIIVMGLGGHAIAGPGNCENFTFPVSPENKVDWPHTIKVVKQEVPVFQDAVSNAVVSTLNFNKSLRVLDEQGTRLQVGHQSTYAPLGWVERSNLLCTNVPLKSDKSGLEQKLYIQTATEVRKDKPTTVKAYPSPDLQDCHGQCRELSRFSGYFVFDIEGEEYAEEKHRRYLLSETYRLDDTSQLVGWVNGENGFIWDTAYGARPREDLVFADGETLDDEDVSGQPRTVCAYQHRGDAITDPEGRCLPLLGGKQWYLSEHRIPVLERVEHEGVLLYKVVLPLGGTGARAGKEVGTIRVNPAQFEQNPGLESLQQMKRIDVMFLIDGTKSMVHHLQAVKGSRMQGKEGIIQQIIKTLKEDDAFQEAQFRFGFRIYRDTYAGAQELGEGLPLPTQCELTLDAKERNIREFEAAIDRVEVSEEARDDYAENLFGGMQQAIRDLAPCPDNTKLLFVLGDCGYDAQAQQRRGVPPIEMDSIVSRLKGGEDFKNIVTFFIQTPKDTASVNSPAKYERAYDLFIKQSQDILSHLLGLEHIAEFDNFFMTTDAGDLNKRILNGVKQFSNTQVINEIVLDLRGGTALRDAITRLQGSDEYNNIPGLFWDLVEQGSCKKLGEQCQNRIYDTIIEGYIPVSNDIVEDVWLKSDDLDKWISILRNFDSNYLSTLSGTELRQTFVYAMKEGLQNVIMKPLYDDTGETLREYLRRKGGLPVSDTSPLFGYSIADLEDPDSVPQCEINRLTTWVNNSKQMLNIIYHGDLRPVFTEIPYPGECPTGAKIPFIDGDIQSAPLGAPDMRYNHSFQKANIYWVPKEFLP